MKLIHYNRLFALIICTALVFVLCACQTTESDDSAVDTGSQTEDTDAAVPSIPEGMQSSLPSTGVSAAQDGATDETAANEAMQTATALIGQEVSELYAKIGEPTDSAYVQSCLGAGEDGELYYDGFTVVTYREGDSEVIRGVY